MDYDRRGSNEYDLTWQGENMNLRRELAEWRAEERMHKGELLEQSRRSSIQVLQRIRKHRCTNKGEDWKNVPQRLESR